MEHKKRVAILGGGPAGLFMYKRFTDTGHAGFEIEIFERKAQLGAGMPYSTQGAGKEHVTNVSGNEIPDIVTSVSDWIATLPKEILAEYGMTANYYNDYKVLPRLLFGQYLEAQFKMLQQLAEEKGISTTIHLGNEVKDVEYLPDENAVWVTAGESKYKFDYAIICIGHSWPKKYERHYSHYFDSPYPPAKLTLRLNHAVAVRGSSLTAVDAIRTLARSNGAFTHIEDGKTVFVATEGAADFKIVMHTRNGLLPAVRFHLEDSHLKNDSLLTEEEIAKHKSENDGFLSLDYIFEKDFKEQLRQREPEFYERIRPMNMEAFVAHVMELRERLEPFTLLKAEYAEAEKSIRREQSVYWKEMLAVLSFAMNYPAKYLSAEDMVRLKETLMPLISIVIAFLPQTSAREMMALHDAGRLEIVSVGDDSEVVPEQEGGITYNYKDDNGETQSVRYKTFVDCIGQPHLQYKDFPFAGLREGRVISPAKIKFRNATAGAGALAGGNDKVERTADGGYYLNVPGIGINDDFQVLNEYGAYNPCVYIMAVPYIGGYNPDYSGLDFTEAASERIINSITGSKL